MKMMMEKFNLMNLKSASNLYTMMIYSPLTQAKK